MSTPARRSSDLLEFDDTSSSEVELVRHDVIGEGYRLCIALSCMSIGDVCLFFFNDTPPTEIYTLSLHDALPILTQRELRHDVELFVDVEQLVAESCEHDAAHIGAGHRRVEDVRVLGEPDPQRGLGLNGCAERQQQRRRGDCQTKDFHCCHPLIHHYAVGRVPDISTPARPAPSVPPLKAATNFSRTGEKPPSAGTILPGGGNSVVR